jgi:hypothetical protein
VLWGNGIGPLGKRMFHVLVYMYLKGLEARRERLEMRKERRESRRKRRIEAAVAEKKKAFDAEWVAKRKKQKREKGKKRNGRKRRGVKEEEEEEEEVMVEVDEAEVEAWEKVRKEVKEEVAQDVDDTDAGRGGRKEEGVGDAEDEASEAEQDEDEDEDKDDVEGGSESVNRVRMDVFVDMCRFAMVGQNETVVVRTLAVCVHFAVCVCGVLRVCVCVCLLCVCFL